MDEKYRAAMAAKVVEEFKGHANVARLLGYEDRRSVWPWTNGSREFPPEHCVVIEQKSDRRITRQDLRPDDWQLIWPELAPTEDARGVSHA